MASEALGQKCGFNALGPGAGTYERISRAGCHDCKSYSVSVRIIHKCSIIEW